MPLVINAHRAAMYVRMSTEHQQYSTENQADAIEKYADRRNFSIVKKFADLGKSGVSLFGRSGLREMLQEVESRVADFGIILVYDVSRWGRFQDADESAYYEFVCKRAGVQVHYCAEQFQNDGSISSALLKTIKRAMAGEFSRELSAKTFAGQSRLVEMGFRQGGPAGFGLRRQLLACDGSVKQVLEFGERKSIQTDRVVLIPGPKEEVLIVREIFSLFTIHHRSEKEIAETLNERCIKTDRGRAWSRRGVQLLLSNPKYAGSNVFNRESVKLNMKRVRNPPAMWIRRDSAFAAIVPTEQFLKAQEIIQARPGYVSDQRLLDQLAHILQKVGRLSETVIDEASDTASSDTFRRRFKTLRNAYSMIGYTPNRNYEYKTINKLLKERHKELCEEIKGILLRYGGTIEASTETGVLLINKSFTVRLILCRCRETRSAGSHRWLVRRGDPSLSDLTIAARLQHGNESIRDYFVFPNVDTLPRNILLKVLNPGALEIYHFDTLDFLANCGSRVMMRSTLDTGTAQRTPPNLRGPKLKRVLGVIKQSPAAIKDNKALTTRNRTIRCTAKVYEEHTRAQLAVVRRSHVLQDRLALVASACRRLFADQHFVTLLRAEGLALIPECLVEQMKKK